MRIHGGGSITRRPKIYAFHVPARMVLELSLQKHNYC
jgi:hypothetical protein